MGPPLLLKNLSTYRFRHLALLAGLLVAYGWRLPTGMDNRLLWIVGVLALANLVLDRVSRGYPAGGWPTLLAAMISLSGWSLLVRMTGGVGSPFIAGLAAEVVLTGYEISPARTLLVTTTAILGFWVASSVNQGQHELRSQLIMSAVLSALGAVTMIQAQRRRKAQASLEQSLRDVRRQLDSLADTANHLPSLAEERRIRIAHGLKNNVHSFRGLVALLESEVTNTDRGQRIIGALGNLANQIEDFGRLAIQEQKDMERSDEKSVDAGQALEPILSEARLIWPHLQFEGSCAEAPMLIALSPGEFHEVLLNLLSNAAESARQGRVRVSIHRSSSGIDIRMDDDGPRLTTSPFSRVGMAGHSTRGEGRGYGLFIVRRLVERIGGRLDVELGIHGGAHIHMAIPAGGGGLICLEQES